VGLGRLNIHTVFLQNKDKLSAFNHPITMTDEQQNEQKLQLKCTTVMLHLSNFLCMITAVVSVPSVLCKSVMASLFYILCTKFCMYRISAECIAHAAIFFPSFFPFFSLAACCRCCCCACSAKSKVTYSSPTSTIPG